MPVENTTLYLRSVRRGKLPCSYGWSYTWSYLNGLHKLASGHVTWKKEKETFTGTIVNRYFPHRHANENAFKSSFLSSNQHPVRPVYSKFCRHNESSLFSTRYFCDSFCMQKAFGLSRRWSQHFPTSSYNYPWITQVLKTVVEVILF